MAVIHDMIPAFELFQPTDIDGAVDLLDRYGEDAWVLAGGLDSMDWFKDRVKRPTAVVDLGGLAELVGVRSFAEGLEIGALTSLTAVIEDAEVSAQYGLLVEAAQTVATPQIRNQGTIGGNLCQDTRCWYYRGGWPCYRAGGNICYASTPTSMDREHCIFGADRCVAVNPSDTAPALIALDAEMVIRSRKGQRTVAAEDFFIGPGSDITRMTVLEPGDLLVAIRLPSTWAGARFYFEKVCDRQAWDFALVSVASAIKVSNGSVQDIRLAVNGVAPFPMRLRKAEDRLRGQTIEEASVEGAAKIAVLGARPLNQNRFKIPLMRNLVKRAVRETEA